MGSFRFNNTAALVVCALSHFAQADFKQDIIEVSRHMALLKKYSVTLKYNMYLDNDLARPFETRVLSIKQDGGNCNILTGKDYEVIETGTEQLDVDYRNHKMYYARVADRPSENVYGEINDMYTQFAENYDSLNLYIKSINLLYDHNQVKEYEIVYKEGEYTRLIIRMDMKSGLYKSVTAHFRQKNVVEKKPDAKPRSICIKVNYENYNTSPAFSSNTFDTSKFLVKQGKDEVRLHQSFQNYKLIIF